MLFIIKMPSQVLSYFLHSFDKSKAKLHKIWELFLERFPIMVKPLEIGWTFTVIKKCS